MIAPTFLELAYVRAVFYKGDEDDEKSYHLELHCLLDFNGEEVVTVFSINLDQFREMDIAIPDHYMITMVREDDEPLGSVTFEEFKRSH